MMMIAMVCVIGAGVMGSAIAAHIANAGIPALLLDIVPVGAVDRNVLARAAVERLLKTEPAPFMVNSAARLIEIGNLEDELFKLAGCDWIIEAVTERLDVKQALYAKVEPFRKPGSIFSSNTSTLRLATLMQGMPLGLRRDFCIAHFFNPPRYMRLLEVVAGADTRPDAIAQVGEFADVKLGKAVVAAKDTPGFIANRIGVFWIQCAINAARELRLRIEEADALMGRPIGAPKSGVFDLLDIVGLDLLPHIDASLRAALPESDPYVQLRVDFPLLQKMIAEGYTGRKGKGGFYRMNREGGKKEKQVVDLATGAHRPIVRVALESLDASKLGLHALVTHPDRGGKYAWLVLSKTLSYAAALVPEISDSIFDVDLAMRAGFNWKCGPFAMIDQIGAGRFVELLVAAKMPVPQFLQTAAKQGGFYKAGQYLSAGGSFSPAARQQGLLLLGDIKTQGKPLATNASASVWDLGDGVACLEFHSKMNSIDLDTLAMALKAIEIVAQGMKALVIHNDGDNFSVGANLGVVLFEANVGAWAKIEHLIARGHKVMKAIKFAPFPVVAAPSGLALGGGCEFILHCAAVQAHAELNMGLVEVGVGIIPGWGGCKEMLLRKQPHSGEAQGPMPAILGAFEQIAQARVSKSASQAKELRYLRESDAITMNKDRLLADAKALALNLAEHYQAPPAAALRLAGTTARTALNLVVDGWVRQGLATPHDVTVARHLAHVLSGGDTDITQGVSEDEVMELERQEFMKLVRLEPTLMRMESMLATGKTLRN